MAHFNVVSRHSSGEAVENYGKSRSCRSITQPRFETDSFRLQVVTDLGYSSPPPPSDDVTFALQQGGLEIAAFFFLQNWCSG